MTTTFRRDRALACVAAALALSGCGPPGKVEQGRVIAYDPQTRQVTLIQEPAGRSPIQPRDSAARDYRDPRDPDEMGPAPVAGGLMLLDAKNRRIVFTIGPRNPSAPSRTRRSKSATTSPRAPRAPVVDRARKTITLYSAKDRSLITFAASDDLLAMPADTWQSGDVVRYYYKDPARALRLMNVTRTDLSKA